MLGRRNLKTKKNLMRKGNDGSQERTYFIAKMPDFECFGYFDLIV